jgi:hypothetical protein
VHVSGLYTCVNVRFMIIANPVSKNTAIRAFAAALLNVFDDDDDCNATANQVFHYFMTVAVLDICSWGGAHFSVGGGQLGPRSPGALHVCIILQISVRGATSFMGAMAPLAPLEPPLFYDIDCL